MLGMLLDGKGACSCNSFDDSHSMITKVPLFLVILHALRGWQISDPNNLNKAFTEQLCAR